jgi:hypothetical protein
MIANKIKILRGTKNRELVIPITQNWDFSDRGNTVDAFQDEVVKQVLGVPVNYELARFTKKQINVSQQVTTSVIYEFYFYNTGTTSFSNSYVNSGLFTFDEVYYNAKSFDKSFFKMDFYDSTDKKKNKNYLTLVLSNPNTTEVITSNGSNYDTYKPYFNLDYNKGTEGYFIHWFKEFDILSLSAMYMTTKFFNGKTGQFTTFVKGSSQGSPQNFNSGNPYSVSNDDFFQKVEFDFINYEYNFPANGPIDYNHIRWYEYVNPPIQ